MSKVSCICFGFATLTDGLKNSRHFFNQSEVEPKPIAKCLHTFSHILCCMHVFTLGFDWFNGLSVSFVIGQSNYFGFGFMILK